MAFDSERKKFTREHFWYCEVEVSGTTYRFCENRAPIPAGFDGIPSMKSQSMTPAKIDLTGGIGIRASASVSFDEHQDYTVWGTITAPVRFWVNWRARNVGYQGGRLSIFSGYITNNTFDSANFQQRDYVIESFANDARGAAISGKDALKMASGDRAKAPRKSNGLLNADVTDVATSFTLTPTGIGDDEYPAASTGDSTTHYFIRLGDEVCKVTNRSSDVLTVTRGQYNTVAETHDEDDTVQLCLYYNETITDIEYDLLTTYASVPTAQIDLTQWEDEATTYLSGLYEVLITEPTNVSDLLKESGESAPHYMFWDERTNLIKWVAIKAPPTTATCYTSESHLLEGSSQIIDKPDMRISTVIVRFGQFDPTKDLDEASNYRQAHVRITPASITKYGGIEKYKIINSRFISSDNRVAAVRLAARIGRRFEEMPRMISFKLDASQADIWTGDGLQIDSDLILDDTGARYCMPAQIITAGESGPYQYTALEHVYGDELAEDLGSDDPNQRMVILAGNNDQLKDPNTGTARTLRDIYDENHADVTNDYDIIFIFDSSCVAGSSDPAEFAVDTGSWPEITTGDPIKLDVRGLLIGKGGAGSDVDGTAGAGGPALILNTDIRLTNTGTIGGGGGGGGFLASGTTEAAGGGGAGYTVGSAGLGTVAGGSDPYSIQPQNGTHTSGGNGGFAQNSFTTVDAGDGGNLGDAGETRTTSTGGAAGAAIDKNGYTITYINTGTILGATLT